MADAKPAYLIASSIMPEGHGSLEAYVEAVRPLLAEAGAETVTVGRAGQPIEQLEGRWPRDAAMTIFRFPSMDALREFWNSPEYAEVKQLREGLADCQVLLIEAPALEVGP